MYIPEWALKYKEPRTEIRFIKGTYYKYEVQYKYNRDKKRTDKQTVRLLGKLTEADGFIPSNKDLMRQKAEQLPKVDIKTFGLYHLFCNLIAPEIASLMETFEEDVVENLLTFSMMRWAYQSPIKRIANYHVHDFCSEVWCKEKVSNKKISDTLKFLGQNREILVAWMKSRLGMQTESANKFVMMDSTHVTTVSEKLAINAKGYNPSFDFEKQIRLMYLFSAELNQPIYYRLLNGNITDIKSMCLCVKEMNVSDVVFIADKGFYSKDNIKQLNENELQYIIPLHRNSALIDFTPLEKANFKKEINRYFEYQGRIIWYYQYQKEKQNIVTFLDEKLRVEEETDYLKRTQTHPEEYTQEKFYEKIHHFGTLTIIEKLKTEQEPQYIYQAYKQRNEIEIMFDSYKNFLDADKMYMQDRYWIFRRY